MSQGITIEQLRSELGAFKESIDGRFDGMDRRFDKIEANHQELMLAVAEVVTQVNDHFDEHISRVERLVRNPYPAF